MDRYAILRRTSEGRSDKRSIDDHWASVLSDPVLSIEQIPEKAKIELAADPLVEAFTPIMPTCIIKPLAGTCSNDVSAWGIAAVGADLTARNGAGTIVAVLDTGIDRLHPAFVGVEILEKDFSGDGDGDRQGHGTHCAGTIFGRDVGTRIGVARGVSRAIIGKVLKDSGAGGSDMIFAGLLWAMREQADIISMSLGLDFPNKVAKLISEGWPSDLATSTALEAYRGNLRMFDAIMGVLKAQAAFGISPLVVAAAGNESRRNEKAEFRISASLPAAAADVIAVAALGRSGEKYSVAEFSNNGALLSAPGVDITSAWPGGGLKTISGTSMACPHVAGVAALWWEELRIAGVRPNSMNVKARLLSHAQTDAFVGGTDQSDVGQGLVRSPK